MTEKDKITKKSGIDTVFEKHPETTNIMNKYGLHCFGCMMSRFETIGDGAKAHGLSDEDIDKMIDEMNKFIQEKGGKKWE